jgi:HK97 family phage major capsid protein
MSTAVLDKIRAERDEARNAALAMAESDDFSPDDKTFGELQARADDLDKRAGTLASLLERQAAADALDGRLAKAQHRDDPREPLTRQSWGEAFVRSEVFTGYPARGTSGRLSLDTPQVRAIPTGVADLIAAGWKGGTVTVDATAPPTPTPLIDAMTGVTVSQNAIDVVVWAKIQGGAAIVAEKTGKPSAEYAPTVTPSTLDTIAVYTQLTRQLVEDAPAVRSLIDGELQREVLVAEESEAAAALAAAALPTATVPLGDSLLSAIRVGIGTVQAAGYNPNAVLVNPADWATLDIAILGGTMAGPVINTNYWGLSVIADNAQPLGTATVGDFRAGVQHYTRSGVSLYITDSHASTFLSNVFTILAERRSKTIVTRPAALVECSVSATAGTQSASRSDK